ncbi:phospholipid scramblase-related protein [Streptomyces sp. NPDC092296]|uniref:phospholipid scramblase-related protein n=1 Tax=Streptomyces sp. NPDC092296 TaxID=3366012 RepID=UPI0037FF80DD
MTTATTPPGWYPDPHGAAGLRWWDGSQWTDHTHAGPAGGGVPPQKPPQDVSSPWEVSVDGAHDADRIRRQVQQKAGVGPVAGGGGTLFSEPVLVVNQKTKLIELAAEYSVFDQNGTPVGSVAEIGQGPLRKVIRFLTSWDQYLSHRLEVRDTLGQPVMLLTRPAKFIKSRVIVTRPDGVQLGEIVQQNAIGKINFALMVGDQQIGAIKAENWRAWNFAITDHTGTEVARITKTFEGLARTLFTTADNYVVQIHRQLPEPLLSMVVASALTVDTALKQDSRGLG